MIATRQVGRRTGGGTKLPWHAAAGRDMRLPGSGVELGYISLTAAFAAIVGVAVATLTPPQSAAPALIAANASKASPITRTGARLVASDPMRPTHIHNLGSRLAVTSAIQRF